MYKNKALFKFTDTTVLIATFASVIAFVFMFSLLFPIKAKAETNIPLCEITRNLKVGSSGEDVRCLQRYLNWAGFSIAATGSGSPGNESAYYGELTANAVARWQNANASQVLTPVGLTTGSGLFGSASFNYYASRVRVALGLSA